MCEEALRRSHNSRRCVSYSRLAADESAKLYSQQCARGLGMQHLGGTGKLEANDLSIACVGDSSVPIDICLQGRDACFTDCEDEKMTRNHCRDA